MYIKFLIGSIIYAGICFGIGYRVCYLRMDKKTKKLETWCKRLEGNYRCLLRQYKAQCGPTCDDLWRDDGR